MHWARADEAGFLGGIRLLYWIYRHSGIWLFRAALYLAMPWFFLRRGVARRASLEYLARLHEMSGGATPAPSWRNSFRHFMSFGEAVLEQLAAVDMRGSVGKAPSFDGVEPLNRVLEAGRGALIVTTHIGSLMSLYQAGCGYYADVRFTLLVHTRHAGRFSQIMRALNPALEIDT
ncbi:MAG: hypothetical protein LBR95_09630, partial [Azoarcus sp.]|nr:hypothetical protein [Azoarcus sp.]